MKFRSLCTCLAAFVCCNCTFAGHWDVEYAGGAGIPTGPYTLGAGGYGGGGSYASGTIHVQFTWVPSEANEPPPDTTQVYEVSSAGGLSYPDSTPVASGNNGLGSPVIVQHFDLGNGYFSTSVSCEGTRITYRQTTDTPTFGFDVSPSASGAQGACVLYSAVASPFAVAIFLDRDPTYHKGADGLPELNHPVPGDPQLSPRNGDVGIGENDVWDWDHDGNPLLYYVYSHVQRELIGPWTNPFHHWNCDPEVFEDTALTEYDSCQTHWFYDPEALALLGESGPDSKHIVLQVVNDGGEGTALTAEYDLRIHNKFDNWRRHLAPWNTWEAVGNWVVANPGYALAGAGITCYWSELGPFWTAMQAVAPPLLSITETFFKNPFFKAGFKAAGITIASLGPRPMSNVAPWAWNWPGSTITGGTWSSQQNYFKMVPSLEQEYENQRWLADRYGTHGYEGQSQDIKAIETGGYRWVGDFSPVGRRLPGDQPE